MECPKGVVTLQALTPQRYKAQLDSGAAHGMSTLMRHYLSGQLAYAGDITFFLAPVINSYKHFQASTFALTRAVWSVNNRAAGFAYVARIRLQSA